MVRTHNSPTYNSTVSPPSRRSYIWSCSSTFFPLERSWRFSRRAKGSEDKRGYDPTSTCSLHILYSTAPLRPCQHIEIYGPPGTRAYVRAGLIYTHTLLGAPYVVHELHTPSDSQDNFSDLPLHPAESPFGRNIPLVNGAWTDIYKNETVSVSAAPILHSVPCIGYVVNEAPVPCKLDPRDYIPHIKRTNAPMSILGLLQKSESVTLADGTVLRGPERRRGRKIVILGDTYDPSPITPLADGADILIHESTNAHLPGIDPSTKESDTFESVETRAKSRGHSTPQMAGAFARRINAKKLVLNHFSARYSSAQCDSAKEIMSSIAGLAAREYGGDVICAEDFMNIDILLEPVV